MQRVAGGIQHTQCYARVASPRPRVVVSTEVGLTIPRPISAEDAQLAVVGIEAEVEKVLGGERNEDARQERQRSAVPGLHPGELATGRRVRLVWSDDPHCHQFEVVVLLCEHYRR